MMETLPPIGRRPGWSVETLVALLPKNGQSISMRSFHLRVCGLYGKMLDDTDTRKRARVAAKRGLVVVEEVLRPRPHLVVARRWAA